MLFYNSLIGVCWVVFLVVWLVFAFGAKRTVRNNWWQRSIYFRIAIAIVVVLLLSHLSTGDHTLRNFRYYGLISSNPIILSIGVILCAAGIAFAIWARVYLGRNWGMPMSLKENPELVTTGPYAYVRHPIYTGMLLAMLGSALASSLVWLIVLVCAGGYFIYSAKTEEKIQTKEFPDAYPAYMKRTKMLVPFVL
jgi:protein-S-isoprenylcysteine O-methyltransferase Ste14